MGPNLLIDKSALEPLAPRELAFLDRHFFLVLPPILLKEIQADIGKGSVPGGDSERWVTILARKVGLNALGTAPWRTLCRSELLGGAIPIDRRCVLLEYEELETSDGVKGARIGVSKVDQQTEQWRLRSLSSGEREEGLRFRQASRAVAPSEYPRLCRHLNIPISRPSDIEALNVLVTSLLSRPELAPRILALVALEARLSRSEWQAALTRCRAVGRPLAALGKYVEHCARVLLTFSAGLLNTTIVGGRATDRIDAEYLFYLPFCQVFCSGDVVHERLAPLLLGSDQEFARASTLKADLSRIADDWARLTPVERQHRELHFGHYPQDEADSLVAALWRRHRPPRKPFSGNLLPVLSEDERKALERLARRFLDGP